MTVLAFKRPRAVQLRLLLLISYQIEFLSLDQVAFQVAKVLRDAVLVCSFNVMVIRNNYEVVIGVLVKED